MNARPARLVLLGHPVEHSLSPRFQNAALRAAGIALEYEAVDVEAAGLVEMAHALIESNSAGNVTVPHKEAFAACCAQLSPVAERAGAVNTFWVEEGTLIGDNTDVGGFEAAVRASVGVPAPGTAVTIIGAGGGARAVLSAVERWEGVTARIWARTMSRAETLAIRFSRIARAEWSAQGALEGAALVINTTPVGLHGTDVPVDPALLGPNATVFDLAYRRGATPWVLACRGRGLAASDGLPMLIEQGALSFERWFGFPPDRNVMREACR